MSIHTYANASGPVRNGAHRLADYAGLCIGDGDAPGPRIIAELNSTFEAGIGSQG